MAVSALDSLSACDGCVVGPFHGDGVGSVGGGAVDELAGGVVADCPPGAVWFLYLSVLVLASDGGGVCGGHGGGSVPLGWLGIPVNSTSGFGGASGELTVVVLTLGIPGVV